jgi:hypothetical protein
MTALNKYLTLIELYNCMQEFLKNTSQYETLEWNFDLLGRQVNMIENSTFETKYNNDTRNSNSKIYIHTQQITHHATNLDKHTAQINQILS